MSNTEYRLTLLKIKDSLDLTWDEMGKKLEVNPKSLLQAEGRGTANLKLISNLYRLGFNLDDMLILVADYNHFKKERAIREKERMRGKKLWC